MPEVNRETFSSHPLLWTGWSLTQELLDAMMHFRHILKRIKKSIFLTIQLIKIRTQIFTDFHGFLKTPYFPIQ